MVPDPQDVVLIVEHRMNRQRIAGFQDLGDVRIAGQHELRPGHLVDPGEEDVVPSGAGDPHRFVIDDEGRARRAPGDDLLDAGAQRATHELEFAGLECPEEPEVVSVRDEPGHLLASDKFSTAPPARAIPCTRARG